MAGEVEIINQIAPKNAGSFPSHSAAFGEGGFRAVADNTARDAITTGRRSEGMYVYVISTDTLYRLGVGLTNADWVVATAGSGTITGNHAALQQPTTPTNLADFLELSFRPEIDPGTAGTDVYADSASGSDATGDGTIGNPVATFGKAVQMAASSPTGNRTIHLLGVGPYSPSGLNLHDLNFVTVTGDNPSVVDTRTITGVGVSSQANGLVLDDAGVAMGVDAHRGKLVQFTSGTLNGQYGVIYRNAANQIEVTQDTQGATFKVPIIGDTYNILDWVTEMQLTAGASYIFESCAGSSFQHFRFTGLGKYLFANDTDKLDFQRCRFELDGLLAGRGGSLFLTTCSVANRGTTFSDWGMLTAITQGIILFKKGTFVDSVRALNVNTAHISGLTEGFIETFGDIVFRGLGTKGVNVRQSGVITLWARLGTLFSHWRYIDCANGITANGSNEGAGWCPVDAPDLFGNITGNWCVDARLGAQVRIGAASGVTTALGTNTVTVNGVASSAQDSHLTMIQGGAPNAQGFAGRYTAAFTNATLAAGVLTVTHDLGVQYVTVAVYNNLGVQVAPDSVTASSTTACAIDLTSQGVLAGTWNVVIIG